MNNATLGAALQSKFVASRFDHRTTRDDAIVLYLVAIGWMYVVLLMTVAEALSPNGSVLGATLTFVFYGVLPLSIMLYILGTPARRRALRAREAAAASATQPDRSGHAASDTLAPVREKP